MVLLLAALALLALVVLAVSLNGMSFRSAQRFAQEEQEQMEAPVAPLPQFESGVPAWKQLLVLGLLILLTIIIGVIISPSFRRRLLAILGKVLIWGVAIYFVMTNPLLGGIFGRLFRDFQRTGKALQSDGAPLSPMPVFEPPRPSSQLAYLISFAFAVLLLAVLWLLYRNWRRYMALNSTRKSLDDIAHIARSSLEDLSAGRNSSDVIINCYLRMSDVVASRRRLQREMAMTPREFAARLEQAGLPGEAVHQLTLLFEGVRYGDRKSPPRDVNEAVRCLQTILHYCGEPV